MVTVRLFINGCQGDAVAWTERTKRTWWTTWTGWTFGKRGARRVGVAGGAAGMEVPAVSFLGRAVTSVADTVAATLRAAGATHPGLRPPLRRRTHPGLRPPVRWRTHPGLRPPLHRRGRRAWSAGPAAPPYPTANGRGYRNARAAERTGHLGMRRVLVLSFVGWSILPGVCLITRHRHRKRS